MTPGNAKRDALIRVIDALHAEIVALKANDAGALERATADKLVHLDAIAAAGTGLPVRSCASWRMRPTG